MIKIFQLLVPRSGQGAETFVARLTEAARPLVGAEGLAGFDVQQALPLPARKDIVQLDVPAAVEAFVEFWVEDDATYDAFLDSAAGRRWREARAEVTQAARTLVLVERPKIPVPAERPATRNNAFLTRHARFTPEEFRHEWHVGHGDMCLSVPYLKAFVPCDVVATLPERDVVELRMAEVEGIAQAYFDTPEDEIAMIQTPEAKAWFAHGAETFGLIKAFGARETIASAPAGAA